MGLVVHCPSPAPKVGRSSEPRSTTAVPGTRLLSYFCTWTFNRLLKLCCLDFRRRHTVNVSKSTAFALPLGKEKSHNGGVSPNIPWFGEWFCDLDSRVSQNEAPLVQFCPHGPHVPPQALPLLSPPLTHVPSSLRPTCSPTCLLLRLSPHYVQRCVFLTQIGPSCSPEQNPLVSFHFS